MTTWDRAAIVLLGAAGFAFSYDALCQIALAIHARETLSYLFPVFIDGFIAYGVRAIMLLRHQRFAARLYAWFLFLAATGASLGANALHAVTLNDAPAGRSALHLADSVVGVLSMLAPLALAGSVHLYIVMARAAELSVRDGADSRPGPVRRESPRPDAFVPQPGPESLAAVVATEAGSQASRPSAAYGAAGAPIDPWKHGFVPTSKYWAAVANGDSSAVADRVIAEPDRPDELLLPPADRTAPPQPRPAARVLAPDPVPDPGDGEEPSIPEATSDPADGEEPSVPDDDGLLQGREADDEWLKDLLPIARAASTEAGRISRDALKEAVRAHQPISNDRLGILLARLREEADASVKTPAGSSKALW
ncbi:DUF2637 domain-containing protein [Streptomyces murinus]|uniref:DUF2637 domain-containing protein n=1 Tax=Streptomyces murinus TaxID=33900 RepID=UPI00382DD55C